MQWVNCPRCGFTQIPSDRCLRCQRILDRQELAAARPTGGDAVPRPRATTRMRPQVVWVAAAGVLALAVTGILVWRARAGSAPRQIAPTVPSGPSPAALDLTGRWQAQSAITLGGPAPRPAVIEARLETDRDGGIVAAEVLLTDPGHGGAGAGYRMATGGRDLLDRVTPLLAAQPSGAALPLDFIPLPPWIPRRPRAWRALEGHRRGWANVRYLVLESLEDDYLVQAGINETGFLSYAFFSPAYASGRGVDALSARIHPAPGSSLTGFQNIIWDFSGAADFLKLEVATTVSDPAHVPTRLLLRRER